MLVLGVTLLVLFVTFVYGVKNKFNIGSGKKRGLARMIMGIYVLFILLSTVIAFKNAYF